MPEVIKPGCFEGEKEKPSGLCQVPDCRNVDDCLWKRRKVPVGLGQDTENRSKILNN